jgi:hypothetical protein
MVRLGGFYNLGRTSKIQQIIQNKQQVINKKNSSKSQPADSRKSESQVRTKTSMGNEILEGTINIRHRKEQTVHDSINPGRAHTNVISYKNNIKRQFMSSKHRQGTGRESQSISPPKYNFKIKQIVPRTIQRPVSYQIENDLNTTSVHESEYETRPRNRDIIGEKVRLNSQKFK